jgi:hypothetical protein
MSPVHMLILVLIIVVILMVCYLVYNSDTLKRKRSEAYIAKSAGGYDANARHALKEIAGITAKTAADTFNYANILRYNVLENRLNPAPPATIAPRAFIYDANYNDGLYLAEPDQHRIIRAIYENYDQALRMLGDGAVAININDPFDLLTEARAQRQNADMVEFMLQRIGELDEAIWEADWPWATDLDGGRTREIRHNVAQQRLSEAAEASNTRAETISKFLDKSIKYTNDGQNVHDREVNNDLRAVLDIVKETYPTNCTPAASIAEAQKYISTVDKTSKRGINAMITLSKISDGNPISTYEEREDQIFSYVWERQKLAENARNAGLMRDAIVDALADSIENGDLTCINGRCGRVLNSLATLDYRPELSGAMTSEAYRNQIYEEVKQIIDLSISDALASADAEVRKIGENYQNGEPADDDNPAERLYRDGLKAKIDAHIDSYGAKLQKKNLDSIRDDCYMVAAI